MTTRSPFHLVDFSPWPFLGSLGALFTTEGIASWFHTNSMMTLTVGLSLTLIVMYNWWRDISREASFQGFHTSYVMNGLRWGMLLFITSEVLFFFAFFWAFFHSSLAPSVEMGCMWPPIGVTAINPFSIPLMNTAILLGSGVTITWAHHSLMEGNNAQTSQALILTIVLGVYFSILQAGEYFDAPFSIADSAYGSTFFVATGFHGLHVLIGTTFLTVCLLRNNNKQFSSFHHFGFEASAWYWHFVDVVWIFLYMTLYWWGS